jgi:charged multivesicular body protein 3
MKVGIIDEMIEETMESMGNLKLLYVFICLEPEEMEEKAQEEVDRILWEVTAGELGNYIAKIFLQCLTLGKAPVAVSDTIADEVAAREAAEMIADRLQSLKET